jgi:hypothetical protein
MHRRSRPRARRHSLLRRGWIRRSPTRWFPLLIQRRPIALARRLTRRRRRPPPRRLQLPRLQLRLLPLLRQPPQPRLRRRNNRRAPPSTAEHR